MYSHALIEGVKKKHADAASLHSAHGVLEHTK